MFPFDSTFVLAIQIAKFFQLVIVSLVSILMNKVRPLWESIAFHFWLGTHSTDLIEEFIRVYPESACHIVNKIKHWIFCFLSHPRRHISVFSFQQVRKHLVRLRETSIVVTDITRCIAVIFEIVSVLFFVFVDNVQIRRLALILHDVDFGWTAPLLGRGRTMQVVAGTLIRQRWGFLLLWSHGGPDRVGLRACNGSRLLFLYRRNGRLVPCDLHRNLLRDVFKHKILIKSWNFFVTRGNRVFNSQLVFFIRFKQIDHKLVFERLGHGVDDSTVLHLADVVNPQFVVDLEPFSVFTGWCLVHY